MISNDISIPKKVINLYSSYILIPWLRNLNNDFTYNYLFGLVELTKNADPDKSNYSDYGKIFYSRSEFSFTDGSVGKNVIIFWADMSSSVHIDNRNKDILILGEGQPQRLDDTTLKEEAKCPINFTQFYTSSIQESLGESRESSGSTWQKFYKKSLVSIERIPRKNTL